MRPDTGEMLPAEARVEIIRDYARKSGFRTFVETGTASGATTAALMDEFDRLYTIELDHNSYLAAFRKFAATPKVTPLHGDSERVIWSVMEVVTEPAVFWLDAHYCGGARAAKDTPIEQELIEIMGRKTTHVILVDDARLFGVDPAYPSVEKVQAFVRGYKSYVFSAADDILRLVPKWL